MTYDERQCIAEWLDIVKRNCERTLRSIENAQDALGEMKWTLKESGANDEKPDHENGETKL